MLLLIGAPALILVSGCHPAQKPSPLPAFTVTPLANPLGGNVVEAYGLDDNGRVAGRAAYAKSAGGHSHAMVWDHGNVRDLGTLDKGGSEADIVTESGGIYGWSSVQKIHIHGVKFGDQGPTDLGVNGGAASQVSAADNAGRYVLTVNETDGSTASYLYNGKTKTALGRLPGYRNTMASCMNDRGEIVGTASNGAGGDRAFIVQGGAMRALPPLTGSTDSFANAINAVGVVAGTASSGAEMHRAVVWKDGKPEELPSGIGKESEAQAINDAGDVVGTCNGHACLWRHARNGQWSLYDLNALADPNQALDLGEALAVNNKGQIACNTVPHNGIKAYLLTPRVPESQ